SRPPKVAAAAAESCARTGGGAAARASAGIRVGRTAQSERAFTRPSGWVHVRDDTLDLDTYARQPFGGGCMRFSFILVTGLLLGGCGSETPLDPSLAASGTAADRLVVMTQNLYPGFNADLVTTALT